MKKLTSFPGPLACGLLLAGAMAASGHGGATGIVEERMMGMMMLSEQIKLLAPIAENPSSSDLDTLTAASEMIAMHAGPAMTDLFPAGSLDAPTVARPEIWERWQEFTGHAIRLGELGEELGISASALASPKSTQELPVAVDEAPVLSEWERMDFAWLMGMATVSAASAGPETTASIAEIIKQAPESAPPARPVRQVYSDIAATCASCHAAFRR